MDIVLTTLNARYIHTAFGLRYLYANLGELQPRAEVVEFTIHQRPMDVAEQLLDKHPSIIGFGVYIWNVSQVSQTVSLLKRLAPEVIIVLGGPEVSHGNDLPEMAVWVDYIIQGNGEIAWRDLCKQVLHHQKPVPKIIQAANIPLDQLILPYHFYTDEDIKNRLLYVEASRGCPFKCEFCLSSLDKTSKSFDLTRFLDEMDELYQRGARNFKFIDRTFNLKVSSSVAILEFFLQRMSDDLYLHFEVVPDNLPDKLKTVIQLYPAHSLQFEVGVQTFDPVIQQLISRRQNNQKTRENLRWLRQQTQAYIHADLIFGLPGDTLENFTRSFDQLVALQPHEIQLGILKRLRGAPLNRHDIAYELKYNAEPPYNILSTSRIDFKTMQRMNRFARYWDMIANSGRFKQTLPLILGQHPFEHFMQLSDALFLQTGSTWKVSLKRLFILLYNYLQQIADIDYQQLFTCLEQDYCRSGEKGRFSQLFTQRKRDGQTGTANRRQKQVLL